MESTSRRRPTDSQLTMVELTAVDNPDEHINNPGEDVDHVRVDLQSKVSRPLWILIVFTILSSTFLFALDNTIVADVQSPIVQRFGEAGKLAWLGVAFVLSGSATIITWGKLYSIFSAKWLYVSSVLLFEGGSALCGAAVNMDMFIVGRTIAGLGGGGMYLGCLNLLSLTTSVRQRPQYIALTGITWGSGTVLGPVVGGAFAQSTATWRWAFYINLCIGLPFVLVYIFLLPRCDPQPEVSTKEKLLQIDYLGAILNIAMLTCLIMGINFGGVIFDWMGGSFGLLFGGLMLLILFMMQQLDACGTTSNERIFPCHLLNWWMFTLFLLMSAAATCVFVPTYYIPLHFQFVHGVSPLTAAVGLLPFIILMVTFGFLNGAMMSKLGYYMPWYLAGGILTTVGGALMTTINENSLNAQVYGYSALIGIGAGCFIQAGFSVAQAKVHPSEEADATSLMSLAQNLGITFSLAISGAVFRSQAIDNLQKILPDLSKDELRGAITGNDSGVITHLDDDTRAKLIHAIVKAMSHTYFLVVSAGVMAVIGSAYLKRERIFIKAAGAA